MPLFSRWTADPFRLFFPLGIVLGLMGMVPWLDLVWTDRVYPAVWHKFTMIDGFMLSFVSGFLMTALPRFTRAHHATPAEIMRQMLLLLGAQAAMLAADLSLHHALTALSVASLILFAGSRFRVRSANPPPSFVFVGFSLALWTLASAALAAGALGWIDSPAIEAFASHVHHQSVLLGLILGIGSRLIPAILGWTEVAPSTGTIEPSLKSLSRPTVLLAIVFFACDWIVLDHPRLGAALRACVIASVAFVFWKIHRRPRIRTRLSVSIWIASWFIMLSALVPIVWNHAASHGAHGTFVAGFSLLTLLVATRVTVSHTEGAFESKLLPWIVGLLLLAAVTRVVAPLLPEHYFSHLAYAAFAWILAVLLWSYAYLGRLLRRS